MQHECIGERIKERRQELGISAADLAERLHMSRATIFRYENGEIKTIKIPVVMSIAYELKVNPAWLLGKTSRKEPLSEITKDDNYVEFTKIFDDLINFMEYRKDVECHGVRMNEVDRYSVAMALRVLLTITETRYKN